MKIHTFTDEDFAEFKAKAEELINTFGLHEWHVTISHEQIGDRVAAQTSCNHVARHASIRLTKQNEGDFGIEWDPKRLALHEVLHLLMWDFCETTAKLGDPTLSLVVAQEHALVNRLMRVL
jgi:hypothetical protein